MCDFHEYGTENIQAKISKERTYKFLSIFPHFLLTKRKTYKRENVCVHGKLRRFPETSVSVQKQEV